jgi:hypothetical protein
MVRLYSFLVFDNYNHISIDHSAFVICSTIALQYVPPPLFLRTPFDLLKESDLEHPHSYRTEILQMTPESEAKLPILPPLLFCAKMKKPSSLLEFCAHPNF